MTGSKPKAGIDALSGLGASINHYVN